MMRKIISSALTGLVLSACGNLALVSTETPTAEPTLESQGSTIAAAPVSTMSPERAQELGELGWIAFTASEGGRRDVFLIRPDGIDEINLTGDLPNTFAEAPVWAPNGALIAFDGVPNSDSKRDVYLVTVGADPEQWDITNRPDEFDCYPSFSPDGSRIVYMSERDGNRDLYIMDLRGNDVQRLTEDERHDYEPSWSPDGRKIAFTSRRDGNSEIYVMDADGSNVVRLTDDPGLDWRPVWSPDGEWIAFESWRTGKGDIYIMRPDGGDLRQLTTDPAEDGHPTFSPDSRYIVFHSQRTGNYQLFLLEVENPEDQWLLETSSVRSLLPVWSPIVDIPGAELLSE